MVSENAAAEEEKDAESAEGAEGEGGEEGEGGGGSKKKIIIIASVALIVLLGAVGAALYFMGFVGKHKAEEPAAEATEGKEGEAAAKGGEAGAAEVSDQPVYYDLEEFIVNLNVGSKRPSFLKMTVSLELANALQIADVEAKLPRIRDSFQVYLRELRSDDLQGSAGIYRLREELLLRINKVVYPAKVNDILFKEILVQ